MATVRGSQNAKQDTIKNKKEEELVRSAEKAAASTKTVSIRDKDDKSVMCGGDCGKVVKKVQQGLKCYGCRTWFHAACGKCSDETYEFLNEHSEDQSIA